MMGAKRNKIMYLASISIIHSMNVRIIYKEYIKEEASKFFRMIRPVVQTRTKVTEAWVTVKEFLNYYKDEAEKEAQKLYNSLIKKEQHG